MGAMVIAKNTKVNSNSFENKKCRWFLENTRNVTRPKRRKTAVYLLSKDKPMKIPVRIQYPILFSNTALYVTINDMVQKNINGTSGVVLIDITVTNKVEPYNIKDLMVLFLDKKKLLK